jgi:hypothetical protein
MITALMILNVSCTAVVGECALLLLAPLPITCAMSNRLENK